MAGYARIATWKTESGRFRVHFTFGAYADQFEVISSRLFSIGWQCRVTQLDPNTSLFR
jgi:hypothetical protein